MADPTTNAHIREDIAQTEATTTTSNADTAAAKAQATLQNARDAVISGTQSAVEAIQNNPTYQQLSSGMDHHLSAFESKSNNEQAHWRKMSGLRLL